MPTRFIELAGEINSSMPNYVVNKTAEALNTVKKLLAEVRLESSEWLIKRTLMITGKAHLSNCWNYFYSAVLKLAIATRTCPACLK